jgi:lysophospholipase L1-like esterase
MAKLNINKIISLITQIIWTLFATFLLLFIIEGCVRIFYSGTEIFDFNKFIATRPGPFKNDPDFDIIFDKSCDKKTPPLITKDGEIFYPYDFSCGGTTYINKRRLTLPLVENNFTKSIHVFGGSTVWGTGATDANTIPSLIQNEFLLKNYRVINYGMTSVVAQQETNILLKNISEIKKGDIVIFYDGGNDFWNSVMQGNIGGTIIGFNQKNKFQLFLFEIRNWLYRNSRTYVALSDIKNGRKKSRECLINFEEASKRVSTSAKFYANSINNARKLTEERGAYFLHFFQPTLFDTQKSTLYESELYNQNPCYSIAQKLKPEFNSIFLNISKSSVDLSSIFTNKDLLWDYIHTSSKGNKEAVNKILPHINSLLIEK